MAILGTLLPPIAADILAGGSVVAATAAAYVYSRMQNVLSRETAGREELTASLEHLSEGFYRINASGRFTYANPAFARMHGYRDWNDFRSATDGPAADVYIDPERRKEFLSILDRDGVVTGFVSQIHCLKTGEVIWVQENARQVRNAQGTLTHYEGTVRETTSVVERMKSEARLQKLTQHLPGGLFQLEHRGKSEFAVVFASSGFCDMLDQRFSPEGFDVAHFVSLIHPEDLPGYYESLKLSRKTGHVWLHEFRVVTDAGKTKWFKVHATPERGENGSMIWHGYLQDVSLLKADQAEIRQMAFNDPLTKLPNRRFLADRLGASLASCGRRHEQSALLFIDVDNFKALNDSHGHEAGDRLLVEFANRLRRVVRRNDTVARLAGDEFVILLDGISSDKALSAKRALLVAQKASEALRRPFVVSAGVDYSGTASIGVIIFDETSKSVDEILKRADLAMYEVKHSGRDSYKLFQPRQDVQGTQKAELGETLAGAVARGELDLRLQPQVDGAGIVIGAEALLRWNHPKFGLLTPDMFMRVAEQTGMIAELNRFVIEEAVAILRNWAASSSSAKLSLSVNLGGEQLLRSDFARELRALLRSSGIRAGALVLEVTEQMLSSCRGDARKILAQLKTTGVNLSLDDFGAGYTSLSSLKELPVDEIKIDGRFVKAMATGKKDMAIVKSILALASALGMSAVAEHVETQAQEELLLTEGCTRFQGFLYGGALSRPDFELMAGIGSYEANRKVA